MKFEKMVEGMTKIVEEIVDRYKCDFYEHDIDMLIKMRNKAIETGENIGFNWYVRECGTHLAKASDKEYIETIESCFTKENMVKSVCQFDEKGDFHCYLVRYGTPQMNDFVSSVWDDIMEEA